MSDRWTRALLRAYPRRIRRRYGSELLDLQDQLRAEGRLSRRRLVGDALLGARLARLGRRWASGVLVAAVALAAAIVFIGGHERRPSSGADARRAMSVLAPDPYGVTSPYFAPNGDDACYGGSSMTCAGGGCRPTPRGCKAPPELPRPRMTDRERVRRLAGERLPL